MQEMVLAPRSKGLLETLLQNREAIEAAVEEEEYECEHFAYRRTLLFYRTECKYCRYAHMIKTENGEREYTCSFAEKEAN